VLDRLYAGSARARRRWYERRPESRRHLRHPVISIGNLTVGGSGKTPLAASVAAHLCDRGERPAILSRGYGRADRADGVVVVSDGTRILAPLARAGDEPLMLARQVPGAIVAVAEDRHLAGLVAERQLGATVHVLDDGFQHLALARDLDVLLTWPGEILSGRPLPFGRLREEPAAAARADVVVVFDADLDTARREAFDLGISQVLCARKALRPLMRARSAAPEPGSARSKQGSALRSEQGSALRSEQGSALRSEQGSALRSEQGSALRSEQGSVAALPSRGSAAFGASLPSEGSTLGAPLPGEGSTLGAPLVAVAGIARPESFFDLLRGAGHTVVRTIAYPDHHRYDARDLARLAEAIRSSSAAAVVTTEKDAVRFEPIERLPFDLLIAPMALVFDGWETLAACVDAALARRREPA
jgi:tetraacyldisaccharide-1-P 4'-kinase